MESSSEDGSFVWTDASNSSSSEDMVTNTAVTQGNSGGEESEYDKSYKKKLHKELYTNENGHERKVKTKKRKRERYTSESEHSETSRKKIKVEPESDLDVARVEDKYPVLAVNGYDELLLNEKVKKEQEFLLPSDKGKKKKKRKSTSSENVKCDTNNRDEEKPSNESQDLSSQVICGASDRDDYIVTKKKKKKSEKREESAHVMEIDDNPSALQQQTSISNKSKKKDKEKSSINESGDLTAALDSTIADLDISDISKISNVNTTQDESHMVQNDNARRRLSERIHFEGDVVDSERSREVRARTLSDKLRRFAEKQGTLRACALRELTEFTIGDDDEVWVVTCPSDVDVAAFTGRSLELGPHCKVKLQGATYEGGAETAGARVALLAGGGVRRAALAGRLALRRRAARGPPAPAAPPPAALASPRPLPATKLRHPLLGAHYKKALRLPAAVRERLQAPAPAPGRLEAPPAPFKKKAKRKRHDLEAPETWASERAIEESLFNF